MLREIAQEQFIEMVNKTDIGSKFSFSETQFSANKLLEYEPLANIFKWFEMVCG